MHSLSSGLARRAGLRGRCRITLAQICAGENCTVRSHQHPRKYDSKTAWVCIRAPPKGLRRRPTARILGGLRMTEKGRRTIVDGLPTYPSICFSETETSLRFQTSHLMEDGSDMRRKPPFPQDLADYPSIASVNHDEVSDFPFGRCGLRRRKIFVVSRCLVRRYRPVRNGIAARRH